MLKIEFTGEYLVMLKNLIADEEVADLVAEKIVLFRNNPQDTRLRNHALTRSMASKWSFSITGDIRIVYEWLGKNTVRFLAIGTHQEVY